MRRILAVAASAVLVVTISSLTVSSRTAAVAQTGGPSVPQVGLEPSEVPGFSPVDRSVQTYQDPSDAGVDQAFISCAGTDPLLSQYDEGGDSLVSQVYGQGDNGFGAPALSVASVVFGSSNSSEVEGAYTQLVSANFQQCWLRGIDSLNEAQGAVTPNTPSTLSSLSMPSLGSAASGYLMHWDVSAEGRPLRGEFGVSVVKTEPYVVAVFTLAWNSSFPDATRQSILQRFVGRIATSGTPATTVPAAPPPSAPSPVEPPPVAPPPPVSCQPDQAPSGDAGAGARLAQTSLDNQDLNAVSSLLTTTGALQTVYQHRDDPEFLVGLFNALDTQWVISSLSFDTNGQPLAPEGYLPAENTIGSDQVGDWFLKEFETAAATCQLSRDTAYRILNGVNDYKARLIQTLSQDPDAARGLTIHLSWQDILQAPQLPEAPAYSEFAASALAAGTEISVLAPPPWPADPTAHFSLDQALSLELKAEFTTDGESTLESALARYAQATEPPPPPAQQLGALAAGDAYSTWATHIGDIDWAMSVGYATLTAKGWIQPSVADWYEQLRRHDDLPGANPNLSGAPGALADSNVDGATEYAVMLERNVVTWLRYQANASAIQQQDQADAAWWLCGREPRVEGMLFLSMLHSNRLLYTLDGSVTNRAAWVPLHNGVVIKGFIVDFDRGQFPPMPLASVGSQTDFYNNIQWVLRPPTGETFSSVLADASGQSTGLSARVPFDSVVWSWDQKLSSAGATACTRFPAVSESPTSGIGTAIMVTRSGYAPNTPVAITGHSKPVLLATAWTNGSGQFAAFVDPAGHLPPGAHQLIVSGRGPNGSIRVLSWALQVRGVQARRPNPADDGWQKVVLVGLIAVVTVFFLARGRVLRRRSTRCQVVHKVNLGPPRV